MRSCNRDGCLERFTPVHGQFCLTQDTHTWLHRQINFNTSHSS